jgi:hypothetical protein
MCFDNDVPGPSAPAETLDQAAPAKKTANQNTGGALAIGTKKYRTETGLGPISGKTRPTGPSVST